VYVCDMPIEDRNYTKVFSPPEVEIFKAFINELLIPSHGRIHYLASLGEVVVAAFDPLPSIYGIFQPLGGQPGGGPIFAMSSTGRKELGDYELVTKNWLDRKLKPGFAKIFAVIHSGTFLTTWSSNHDLEIELGSTDAERGSKNSS
jgi:hypothetical protein